MELQTLTPSTGDKQPQYRRHCGDAPHRVRVMIVEDSAVVREFLQHAIGCDRRLQLVASVRSAEEALRCVEQVSPDVISMDIRLPGMNGFEATRRIMADCPTPIVVVAASVDSEDLQISMNALRAGALAVLEKPAATTSADYAALGEQLCTRLVIMSQVNVVRQRFAVQPGGASALTERRRTIARRRSVDSIQMVGMVASTGGPNALDSVLKHFTRDFPTPIAIVQHITASFQDAFVAWLRDISPLPVKEAAEAMRPEPGVVYVAPAERHLVVEPNGFRLDRGEPVCLQRPSGTILLKSIAASYGSRALGVLLTGMGEDGAAGLHALYDADAQTIAEDESTAVVYGMPAAAMRLGAVRESLPLHEIGPRIMELIAR